MTRTRLILLMGLLAAGLSLLAAACTPDDSSRPGAETGSTESTADTTGAGSSEAMTETTAAGTCTDALGCVEVKAGEPIKLAYMLVVAGENEKLGLDSKQGAELALADKPMVLGHPVTLTGEDSGCSAEGGQAAAQKLAADKTIVAVIGSSCSSESRPGAPIISEAGLTMISPSATAPDLTDPAKRAPGFFRSAHNDKVQGKVAAEFVTQGLSLTKVATINDGSPYAAGLVGAFEENFIALGGTITSHEAVGDKDTDMRPVLTTIAQGNPEMLYYPIFTGGGGFVTNQAQDVAGLKGIAKMGADGLFSTDFMKAAGKPGVGMYLSSPDFSTFGTAYNEKFIPAYEAKFGTKPISAFHAHAYDAANMIFAAIEKVAVSNADGSLSIGRQAIRDAIAATKDFQGLTGNLSCDANGDCADPHIAVYKVSDDNVTKGETPTAADIVWPKPEPRPARDMGAPNAAPPCPFAMATAARPNPTLVDDHSHG